LNDPNAYNQYQQDQASNQAAMNEQYMNQAQRDVQQNQAPQFDNPAYQVGGVIRPTSAEAYGERPLPVPQTRQTSQEKYGGTGFEEPGRTYDVDGVELDPAVIDLGPNMYDELQDVGMQDYQQFQQGGAMPPGAEAQQVPGGEIDQVTERGQEVKGDNPGMTDDVELGTNPGEPDAVVDHGEVMVDAVDEQGQPFKQIFSSTVIDPTTGNDFAKDVKKLLKQVPKDEESDQAKRVYDKIDAKFQMQQMLNGDSQGESPEEAAAGGMDPAAAQQMQGQGAFQGGGEGYPSAGYHAALSEQQMQVPYPRKGFAEGGWLSNMGNAIGSDFQSEFTTDEGKTDWGSIATTGMNTVQSVMKGYAGGYGAGRSDTEAGKIGSSMMPLKV